ncbi:MAG: type I-U CRISPR-associated protein Csx17, partial [Proteobacteria bacterium]|nr:type I-U CRISPR-associated protein Csx17 [Pseudomonadota bacterium]
QVRFPALLGTGGNDGRLDFTNNQMQRLVGLFSPDSGEPGANAEPLLRAALFGDHAAGLISKAAIGQFAPGAAGGANASTGFGGDSLINPWDFVLMLEGAVLLRVAAVRRLNSDDLPQASAPFAVRSQAGGYASASAADESARGEQWMPLWNAPATLAEVRTLFAEGRLQSGRRPAQRAVDAARAVARLGAARGVRTFVRFGFIERNGQANLAVPLGHWQVGPQPHVHLLDEIDPWVESLRRASRAIGAPASLATDVRIIEQAMLLVCKEGGRTDRWAGLLGALGRAEDNLLARPKSTFSQGLQPLPVLSTGWLDAADDGTAEVRLAAALASQYAARDNEFGLGPVRVHCLPLSQRQDKSYTGRFATAAESLARDRRVVWTGRNAVADMAAIAMRRLLDCRGAGTGSFELRGRRFADLADIEQFLAGQLDDWRLASIARALMAVRWTASKARDRVDRPVPSPLYALFRLLYRPRQPGGNRELVALDPEPLRLLLAGRVGEATRQALRRIRLDYGRPRLYRALGSSAHAQRLAASLCFPIESGDLTWLRERLCLSEPEDTAESTDQS